MRGSEYPYQKIGGYLKNQRERLNESVAEVSLAVEIEIDTLTQIETGKLLPSEDILVLLLSHLNVDDKTARKVFALAGYGLGEGEKTEQSQSTKPQVYMVVPGGQAQFADEVEVVAGKSGVTLSFKQPANQGVITIADVGLSKELCKELVQKLKQALHTEEKPVTKLLNSTNSEV